MAKEAYSATIDALDALEQAIIEICDVEMAQAIHARKKVILRR